MTRSTTKQLNFEQLELKLPESSLVMQLMMASNDLTDANRALTTWKCAQEEKGASIGTGTGLYFQRIHLAHLYESMQVLERVRANPKLLRIVRQCDQHTNSWFNELETYLKNGSNYSEFQSLVGKVRHSLTFHYDESGKQIEKAIKDRASRKEARISSITRGSHAHLWDFKVAHDIVNSIMVRQIWKVPRDKDVIKELEKISDKLFRIQVVFIDFSGEFVWHYFSSQ